MIIQTKFNIKDKVQIIYPGDYNGYKGIVAEIRIYNNIHIIYIVMLDITDDESIEIHIEEEFLKLEESN